MTRITRLRPLIFEYTSTRTFNPVLPPTGVVYNCYGEVIANLYEETAADSIMDEFDDYPS